MANKDNKRSRVKNKHSSPSRQSPNIERFEYSESQKQNPDQKVKPIVAKNPSQKRYLNAIETSTITFASGPAGVGKTWLAGAYAAQQLLDGEIDKIIITRPAVEAGEELGFLPGEVEDKYAPYLAPFRGVLDERMGRSLVGYLMKRGKIETAPFAYMRGATFKNALVILDEAQNVTPKQMEMFLTRIGEGSKIIANGDLDQKDIPGKSGLTDAISRLSFISSITHVRFDHNDVVRSGICQEIVQAYREGVDPVYNKR